jgi:hypothetical protein
MFAQRFTSPRACRIALSLAICLAFVLLAAFAGSSSAAGGSSSPLYLCKTMAGPDKGNVRFAVAGRCRRGELRMQVLNSFTPNAIGSEEEGTPGVAAVGEGSLIGEDILVTGVATSDAPTRGLSYLPPFLATAPTASDFPAQQTVPIGGTIANLSVKVGTAPGESNSYTLTIRKNGIGTGLVCRIEGDGSADTSCLDNVHTVPFAAGDFLTLQVSPGGSPQRWHAARWAVTLTP